MTLDIPPALYENLREQLETQREDALSVLKAQKITDPKLLEHPKVLEEMILQLGKVAAAENALDTLCKNFTLNG